MPRDGFTTITVQLDVADLIDEIRESLPMHVSRGEMVRLLGAYWQQKKPDIARFLRDQK